MGLNIWLTSKDVGLNIWLASKEVGLNEWLTDMEGYVGLNIWLAGVWRRGGWGEGVVKTPLQFLEV